METLDLFSNVIYGVLSIGHLCVGVFLLEFYDVMVTVWGRNVRYYWKIILGMFILSQGAIFMV